MILDKHLYVHLVIEHNKNMEQLWLVTWKSALVFVMLMVLTRVIGKKLLSQLTFFDFVIGITIGTIGGAYVVVMVKGMWVLLSPIILTVLTFLFGLISLKHLGFRKLIEGEPVVVIQNGKLFEKNMAKLRYHIDDLEMQLREKGIFNFGEVEFAVLEPHGQLSVLKKSQNLPVTPQDLGIHTKYKGMATELIKDGDLLKQNLSQNNLSEKWLFDELKKQNITNLSEVIYAALNTDGALFIDKKNDNPDYIQKIEDPLKP